MARVLLWLTLVTVASLFSERSDAATATLDLPHGNVREGDQSVVLICRIRNPPDDYEAVFIREFNSGGMDIIFINGRVRHDIRDKYSVSLRGEHSIALTLRNISRTDTGNYGCRVAVPTGTTSTSFVASAIAYLDVFYLPDAAVSPHCSIYDTNNNPLDPSQQQLKLGQRIKYQCLSQAGNPIVDMEWTQSNMKESHPDARVSTPASHAGVVVSELDVTLSPEHFRDVFSCVITSSGFPAFSRICTIGPFVSLPASATSPPPLTHPHIDSNTRESIRRGEPIGPSDEGFLSTLGLPVLAGVPAALLLLIIIIVAIVAVRCQRRQRYTDSKHRESQAHLISVNVNGHHAENGNLKRESSQVEHVLSPNGGQLYAVVQKSKPEGTDNNCNKDIPLNTTKTIPIVSMTASQKIKHYPPPPAYPTKHQQVELNKIIDKNVNPGVAKTAGSNNAKAPTPHFEMSSPKQDDRTISVNSSTHEYATLCEAAPCPGDGVPPASRTQRNNTTGLYNTVKLY